MNAQSLYKPLYKLWLSYIQEIDPHNSDIELPVAKEKEETTHTHMYQRAGVMWDKFSDGDNQLLRNSADLLYMLTTRQFYYKRVK